MDKAKPRREPQGDDGGLADAVKHGIRHRQGAIDGVGFVPVLLLVAALFPRHAILAGKLAISLAHADALQPADLPQRKPRTIHVRKAPHIHAPHDLHVRFFVHAQFGLQKQVGGAARLSHAHRVKARAELAAPDHRAALSQIALIAAWVTRTPGPSSSTVMAAMGTGTRSPSRRATMESASCSMTACSM